MELKDLIGRGFKYVSPYSKKESEWDGVVKDYKIIQSCFENKNGRYKFTPEIYIISEHGASYKLSELIFLSKN